ncbi:MAG: hypothetical protein KF808_04925 [Cryobacterium sp.]|nr:hypothetical protein [Cryobacterium sp.]
MIRKTSLWYHREAQLDSGLWSVKSFETDEHPDGFVDPDSGITDRDDWLWRSFESPGVMLRFEIADGVIPEVPPLWFVNVDDPRGENPSTHLVAFQTDHLPAGSIISKFSFATMGVPNSSQVGAVHWYRTGIVNQIFVAPQWRRRFIASCLFGAADALHQGNGWPGHLRSDGRRTRLGMLLAAGFRYPQRFADQTAVMAPMDLPESDPDQALD